MLLLQERRDQEAADLLRTVAVDPRFDDEFWPWLDVLTQFRLHGDSPPAVAALTRARRINRYVADYLLDDRARDDTPRTGSRPVGAATPRSRRSPCTRTGPRPRARSPG